MGEKKLSDQVRDAVIASGMSHYAVAKALGVAESTISRFMNAKGGLSMEYLDRLGELLDLHVVSGKRKDGGK
jgi:plasmid maintenance system antidote protein VapI